MYFLYSFCKVMDLKLTRIIYRENTDYLLEIDNIMLVIFINFKLYFDYCSRTENLKKQMYLLAYSNLHQKPALYM